MDVMAEPEIYFDDFPFLCAPIIVCGAGARIQSFPPESGVASLWRRCGRAAPRHLLFPSKTILLAMSLCRITLFFCDDG